MKNGTIAGTLAAIVATANIGLATIAGTILGTPAYMAPEQACGETVDHRADIYSVGILAYEMFAGRLPFQAVTAQQMLAAGTRIFYWR